MKKDLPGPAQLWGSQGLEPGSPKPLVTPITPFLVSTHSCLSGVMASFSSADRFSLHGEEYGHCQLNSSVGKACLLLTALGEGPDWSGLGHLHPWYLGHGE